MRLLCRDDHDTPDICPPHEFTSGWERDTNSQGVIFCTACGDMRYLTPPSTEAPDAESAVPTEKQAGA